MFHGYAAGSALSRPLIAAAAVVCTVSCSLLTAVPDDSAFDESSTVGAGATGQGAQGGTGAGGTGAGGTGAGTSGAGGTGGGCAAPEVSLPPPVDAMCPSNDFSLVVQATANITAELGAASRYNHHTTVVGTYDAAFSYGAIGFDFVANHRNYWILTLDDASSLISGVSVLAHESTSRVTHVVPTSDGGVVVGFHGAPFRVPGQTTDVIGLNDSNGEDALVVKLDSTGAYEWHLQLDGNGDPLSMGLLQLDPSGNLVVGASVAGQGWLLVQRGTDPIQVSPSSAPGEDAFFLLTYDNAGNRVDELIGLGYAALKDVKHRNGFRYLYGSYKGAFPDFGLSEPPAEMSEDQELFVVRLDSSNAVTAHQTFWFDDRPNAALQMVDTGEGLALFASAALGPASSSFSADQTLTLNPGAGASYLVNIDGDLKVEWAQANVLTGNAGAVSGFVSRANGLVATHQLRNSPATVTTEGTEFAGPDTDSLFVKVDGCGEPVGTLDVAAGLPGETLYLTGSSSVCGDLIVGTHAGGQFDLFDSPIAAAPVGKTQAVVLFRSAGLPFP